MKRLERIVEMLRSGEIRLPEEYLKSDEDLHKYAMEFEYAAVHYIEAVKQGRVICIIQGVSRSGMTRRMTFKECRKDTSTGNYWYADLNRLISSAAGIPLNKHHELVVTGCGMDMVFHTHHNVIRCLQQAGFVRKKWAEELAQMTPTTA